MSHDTLSNLYETIFSLALHHKYSINELENLMAYELDIYLDLLGKEMERAQLEQTG